MRSEIGRTMEKWRGTKYDFYLLVHEHLYVFRKPAKCEKSIFEEPWFWAIVAVLIILLVSLFAIILRRKKGRQEKKEPPENVEQVNEKDDLRD